MYITEYFSPIGKMILRADDSALTGLWFEGQRHFPVLSGEKRNDEHGIFVLAERWLDEYFLTRSPKTLVPVSFSGTDFQIKVYKALCSIPWGKTVSYSDIADSVGCSSPRAAANAVARNPVSVIVPCHRVVGKNGTLSGYAGGADKKRWLILHEGIDISRL